MKVIVLILMAAGVVSASNAALPPRYQNVKDLAVMVAFVRSHPLVASSLKSVDLDTYTVHYKGNCKAVFGRKARIRPPGWVGPAAPLEFKRSNCPVE
jgi:hypothetical protein